MRLNLVVLHVKRSGDRIVLDPPGGSMGSDAQCAVHLPDGFLAGLHADFGWREGQWWVAKASADHQLLVNGQLAKVSPMALSVQGHLQLGNVAIQYHQEEALDIGADAQPRSHRKSTSRPVALHSQVTQRLSTIPAFANSSAAGNDATDASLPQAPTRLLNAVPVPDSEAIPLVLADDLQQEIASLKQERAELIERVARLGNENATLREQQEQLQREMDLLLPWVPSADLAQPLPKLPRGDVLKLVQPISDSLKNASQAIQTNDLRLALRGSCGRHRCSLPSCVGSPNERGFCPLGATVCLPSAAYGIVA